MNRKRCPWCGKIIDKKKDTISWDDVFSPSVPRMLRQANCGHCRHKYGQVPLFPYVLKIVVTVILLLVVAFVFQQFGFLFVLAFMPMLLYSLIPYSKLDDRGKPCETNTDLLCEIVIIDKYDKIKRDELYFLDDRFDDSEPFVLASPIRIYHIPKKGDTVLGEFLYMNEENYNYINKDSCGFYDTEMNLVAKIKFITDGDTIS